MIVLNGASRYTLAVKLTREGLRVMQTLVLSEKTCCSLWTLVGLVKRLLTLACHLSHNSSPSVSHIQLSTETMARQLLLLPTTSRFDLRVRRYNPAHAYHHLLLLFLYVAASFSRAAGDNEYTLGTRTLLPSHWHTCFAYWSLQINWQTIITTSLQKD